MEKQELLLSELKKLDPKTAQASHLKLALALFLLVWGAGPVYSDRLNLNGLGTKARSMGGAFVGLADDFSAVFWNPAGLAFVPQNSFGISLNDSIQTATYQQQRYVPGLGNVSILDARMIPRSNFSGLAAGSYSFGERWVAGLGVYSTTGFGVTWDNADMKPLSESNQDIRWSSRVSVITIAPAVAFKLNHLVSLGASLCCNFGRFALDRYAGNFLAPIPDIPYVQPIDLGQYEESSTGRGISAVVGILFRPNDRISIGISFKTADAIEFKGTAKVQGFTALSTALQREISGTSALEKKITWPEWLGLGMAIRPMDRLTLTADLHWTRWSSLDVIQTNYLDANWKTYMGERGNDKMPMYVRDCLQIRMGAEFLLHQFAIRAGFYTDPAPGPENATNILFPDKNSFGVNVGASYSLVGWKLEIGLEYLAARSASSAVNGISVYPPSTGTTWEFWLPGRLTGHALTPSLSLSHKF
jgi:long-chain fatty acid transport protein